MQEIERKFLVLHIGDRLRQRSIRYERYFLRIEADFEERIQMRGDKYERESKFRESDLSRRSEKKEISKAEFETLKRLASKAIIRDSYEISKDPDVTIKVYHGDYEGLIRAEVEFLSLEEARLYQPTDWMGKEITNTKLGKDSQLIQLSSEEFKSLLDALKNP